MADVLEIERARARRHERNERRDARLMAFLVTLHTGKKCTVEDLIGKPNEDEITDEQRERRAQILAAYHSGGKRRSNAE